MKILNIILIIFIALTNEIKADSKNQNLDDYVKINKPRFVNLKPGQFSIHHLNIVHGSGINRSENYRIGFAIRYVSSDTRHLEVKKDSAIHICGQKKILLLI